MQDTSVYMNRVQKIRQNIIFLVFKKCACLKQTLNWEPRCALSLLMRLEHNTNDYRYFNSFVRNFYLFSILSAVEISPGIFMAIKRATMIEAKNL